MRMRAAIGRRARLAAPSLALAMAAFSPAAAQERPIGPCSPYRAADGDIPSEMPGCVRRHRAPPGSLVDEMEFRRDRDRPGAQPEDGDPGDEDLPPRRRRGRVRHRARP